MPSGQTRFLIYLVWVIFFWSFSSWASVFSSIDSDCSTLLEGKAADGHVFQKVWLTHVNDERTYPEWEQFLKTRHSRGFSPPRSGVEIPTDKAFLKIILQNVKEVRASKAFELSEQETQFLNALDQEVSKNLNNPTIVYDDLINISFYYKVAMQLEVAKLVEKNPPSPYALFSKEKYQVEQGLIDPELKTSNWWPHLKRLVEQAPRLLILPRHVDQSFDGAHEEDFDDQRPYPIYIWGLSRGLISPAFAGPYHFGNHDISHAVLAAEADLEEPGFLKMGNAAIETLKVRLAFYRHFKKELAKVRDPLLRRVIRHGWFNVSHENPRVSYSYAGLYECMQRGHPPEIIISAGLELPKRTSLKKRDRLTKEAAQWLIQFSAAGPEPGDLIQE